MNNIIILVFIIILTFILFIYNFKKKEQFTTKLNKDDIIYIHIGKTGGTTLNKLFKFKEIHQKKIYNSPFFLKNKKYIISIRHPIKRLVSAYNMSKSLIIDNKSGVSNKQAMIRCKKNGYCYTKKYDQIFKKFNSFNDLCEKIFTSQDAYYLITSIAQYQHIGKNMSWYLDNGKFIEDYYKDIIYIAKQETLNDDIKNISKMLGLNFTSKLDYRVNTNKDEYLSPLAIKNLKKLFKNTEYKTLQILYNYGFINKKYLDYCYTYEI